jgi:uncharacterized protein YceK
VRPRVLLAALLLAGCGTVTSTVRRGPAPMAGVRTALVRCEWAPDAAEGLFWLGDVPVSAAADVLLLPVSVPRALLAPAAVHSGAVPCRAAFVRR